MYHEPTDAGHTAYAASDSRPALRVPDADAVHGDGMAPEKRTRSRDGKNIIFRVFPEEHDNIAARAAESGLTISEFIRRIALGYKTQSRLDYDVMGHLIRMHTDMNRLGNLLKLTLKESGGSSAEASLSFTEREWQRSIVKSIEENQELLRNNSGEFAP